MKRTLSLATLAFMLVIQLGISPATVFPQAPTTVYVDQDNTSGTEDGSASYPYNTITEGIAAVAGGGTVFVAPGTYLGQLSIGKSLTLRGSGLDVTTIDGGGQGNAITVATSGLTVTVEGFKITGGGSQSSNSDAGLKSYPGSTLYARWNWFTGNGLNGVVSYGPDVIERNLFTNNGDGSGSGYAIWASSYASAQPRAHIYNNTIRRTTIGDAASNRVGVGIAIYSLSAYPAVPDIRNNIIYNVYNGIQPLYGSLPVTATVGYNIVYSNTTNYQGMAPPVLDLPVDPKLTSTSYLNTGSPAVNAGDPAPAFNDRDGSRNDIGMRQSYLTGTAAYGNFAVESTRQSLGLAAYLGSAVWTSSYFYAPGIYRLAAANGDPLQVLTVPGAGHDRYGGLAYDAATDTLFHSDIFGGGIQKLNGGTGAIKATLPFTVTSGGDLAFDDTYLWQAAGGWMAPRIFKIDPSTGAVVDAFVSPVPGQTQTFGLAYTNSALWLSKGNRIYKIDPATEAIVCSFQAPLDDVRGLAFIPGYDMLASSFSQDKVKRFDLPPGCNENTKPSATIAMQWSPQETHTIQYQPAYSNEAVCAPRARWQSSGFQSGSLLPKTTGGTIRGVRLQLGDAAVVVTGTGLANANLTECGEGTWAIWSASPATWTSATGILALDWHPRPRAGITLSWRGDSQVQTIRYQHRVANEDICTPRETDWANISLESGDDLPIVSDPVAHNYSGLRLQVDAGDNLAVGQLDADTRLTNCGDGLWAVWSVSPGAFAQAYGSIIATWAALPQGLQVRFQGSGAQLPHTFEWQDIAQDEAACSANKTSWISATLQSGETLPLGQKRGVRLKVTADDLLNIQRTEGVRIQKCGGGVYALYAQTPELWREVSGRVIIDWHVLFENLDCTWFQHTETVAHNRELSSHLWCQKDGTATVYYEGGGSGTVNVVDGYASVPAGVNRVRPGGLYAPDLTATLKDRLPVTMHIVPVDLVDVDIDAPTLEILLLAFDMANLPFFDISWEVESTIEVEGDTAAEIWDNMETAMNGQPAVVGSDAYMLVASSADEPVDYELWFGQGPFDTWKGMFFLGHPTTFIHELLHSLLGLRHVGGAPGPDPSWPYGNTDTFPEEATFWGNTQPGTWERLHFTGNDCDALMSYGNSNPYGLDTDYRVRCLSPFSGDEAWDEVDGLAAAALSANALTNGPVMWLEGPDLFKFTLAHTDPGNTGTGPLLIVNPDTSPLTITVPSYETHFGYITDSFVGLPEGVTSAVFDGRHYPSAFGTLSATSIVSDTLSRSLTVNTTCAWLLSTGDDAGERLAGGPYVGTRTVHVDATRVNLQLSCSDGESTQALVFPLRVYLPLVRRQ